MLAHYCFGAASRSISGDGSDALTIGGAGEDPAAVVIGVAAWVSEGVGAGEGGGRDGNDDLGEADHFPDWLVKLCGVRC